MKLSIEVIHDQMRVLIEQRDKSLYSFHQCAGAISALQEQLDYIAKAEEAEKASYAIVATEGEANGEVDS